MGKPVRFFLFPCNQFAFQEPHANSVIKSFAEKYLNLGSGSSVVMFAKSNVNGPCSSDKGCQPSSTACCQANNPIYSYLESVVPGKCDWNFNKFPVGSDGVPTKRYPDNVYASDLEKDIDALLSGADTTVV